MTATMKTWDVTRHENRAGGYEDWIGTVEAPDEEAALCEARHQFECRDTCHLSVDEVIEENAE